jgi:hypothetical protein
LKISELSAEQFFASSDKVVFFPEVIYGLDSLWPGLIGSDNRFQWIPDQVICS